MKKILIIKHGSLGDIVFALPVIHSIKSHYSNKNLDLLTESKYVSFFKKSKYFQSIINDNRSSNFLKTIKILINIMNNKYDLIIDLQNSSRTFYYNIFFRLFCSAKISSSRPFAHFRYQIPAQGIETATQGLLNQIRLISIKEALDIQYHWLHEDLDYQYNKQIVLFIPGVSMSGKNKQWDPIKFGDLARYCEKLGYTICIVGTKNDYKSVLPIIKNCKKLINNIDSSPPNIIYSIAKKSILVVTNDTGPGHIAALSGKNILWILNDNNITKANIDSNSKNLKLLSTDINNISLDTVISYIEKNKLL